MRSTETRHLRASVQVVRLYDDAVASGTAKEGEAECTRDLIRDKTVAIDVHIGTDGYVRRVAATGEIGAIFDATIICSLGGTTRGSSLDLEKSSKFSFTTSIDYYDIGQPVTITLPPADQIADGTTKFLPVGSAIS